MTNRRPSTHAAHPGLTRLGHTKRDFFKVPQMERLGQSLQYQYREQLGRLNRRAEALGIKRGDPIPKQLQRAYAEVMRLAAEMEWLAQAIKQGGGQR